MKKQRRKARGAMRRGQADHAALGIRAIQARIGPAINLGPFDSGGRHWPEIEPTAQVARIHAIDQNLVVVGVAAAHKQRGLRAELARLGHERARHQPQRAHHVLRAAKSAGPNHAGRRASLRLRRRCSRRRHHDGLAHPLRLKHDVALDVVQLPRIESRRLNCRNLLAETTRKKRPCTPVRIWKLPSAAETADATTFPLSQQIHCAPVMRRRKRP